MHGHVHIRALCQCASHNVLTWCRLSCPPSRADVGDLTAGIEKVHGLPSGLSAYEQDALKKCMPELSSSIQKGIDFAKSN